MSNSPLVCEVRRSFNNDSERVWYYIWLDDGVLKHVDERIAHAFPIHTGYGASRGIIYLHGKRQRELRALAREMLAEHYRAGRAPRGGVYAVMP